jgi:starch synthase
MRILHVASEMYPLIKTGGLADVVGALPRALAKGHKADSTVFLPGYPTVLQRLKNKRKMADVTTLGGEAATLLSGKTDTGVAVIAMDAPDLFGFDGDPYAQPGNGPRFAAFSRLAADVAQGIGRRKAYDVVHAHDWQAGLTAAFLKADEANIRTVLTIHNLAFQGVFPRAVFDATGLPRTLWDNVEYWEQLSTLKAGIVYSDHVTTVSPTYALEIQTDEIGMGFGGLLRAQSDKLHGVINGIDPDVWNPATDPAIGANFSAKDLSGKAACKRALQDHFGLAPDAKGPLFCVISRLTEQKGLDLVPALLDGIVARGGQFVLLGSGDAAIEQAFLQARERHPTQVGVTIGYDEPLAHQIQAGADVILIPSRFEPCGLTQLCAMAYGTVPIVSRTGGLMDTVIGATPAAQQAGVATGISFAPVSAHMLWSAIDQTFALYADPAAWAQIRINAMAQDFGWSGPARDYAALYTG